MPKTVTPQKNHLGVVIRIIQQSIQDIADAGRIVKHTIGIYHNLPVWQRDLHSAADFLRETRPQTHHFHAWLKLPPSRRQIHNCTEFHNTGFYLNDKIT